MISSPPSAMMITTASSISDLPAAALARSQDVRFLRKATSLRNPQRLALGITHGKAPAAAVEYACDQCFISAN